MAAAGSTEPGAAEFIADNLPVAHPFGLPELWLHLATPHSRLGAFLERFGNHTPYWAYAWPGGLALARHVLDNPEIVRGKAVLDFGAGSGVVGIAAAVCGAAKVFAFDTDPLALTAIRCNAAANQVDIAIWEGEPERAPVDVILAADVFYAADVAARSMEVLHHHQAMGRTGLIGDIGRHYLPRTGLEMIMAYPVPDIGEADRPHRSGQIFTLLEPPQGDPARHA